MTLDFAYTLYLMLLDDPEIPNAQIKRYVQKWFVLSTLTSRYIGSPETQMDRDMRNIGEKGFLKFLAEVEAKLPLVHGLHHQDRQQGAGNCQACLGWSGTGKSAFGKAGK